MTVGRKRFSAKSVERIVKNFESWRDSNVNGVNTIGTHWEVRKDGKRFGEVTFDGRFRPLDSTDRPPWKMVDDAIAEGFRTEIGRAHV